MDIGQGQVDLEKGMLRMGLVATGLGSVGDDE